MVPIPATFNIYSSTRSLTLGPHQDSPLLRATRHTLSSPTVQLHAGADDHASPPLAACNFRSFSKDMEVWLYQGGGGNAAAGAGAAKSTAPVSVSGFRHYKYRFAVPAGNGGEGQPPLEMEWRRTSGMTHELYAINSGKGERLVARYESAGAWSGRKVAKFQFLSGGGLDGEEDARAAAVVVALGIITKMQRRKNSAAGAAGAAGGGGC